ncbi:branched-chain alpha-keto acid dihydrolipoyl acyltransferase precursor [Theileria orientalis strain Shintoku]|uniref:Dihydrolipoamide acetyltransferase component of pyruvate dehydrogenase complex n=1 Tax=Theileria orientalis strain Shintoku TaxID=869250 RepID=J4CE11_THEOR|nr:branched-chain alpha-keto acid dihydrolipoyl acyltransferase precursor [Theileria orientalis strain Shintoku]BAM42082.1 branched-chain alpha-keto acid dihydrolipoyl acyltransferase precursor [Theileria orientalis strain Shintoku]|eukprot:XP_009692383.1 branched-chain alpha-keto acid dihydrolipoyl acyltransferase precursor [Theileria orientalis strain Shintoku]
MKLLSLFQLVKPRITNTFHSRSIYQSAKRLALTTFKLSDIGEGINEVELLKWEKNVGDQVEEMESVCTVQSDKAAVEITSRYTGTVKKLYVNEGDTIKIGSPLMDIDTVDEVPENNINDRSSNFGNEKRNYSTLVKNRNLPIETLENEKRTFSSTAKGAEEKKDDDVVEVKLDMIGAAMAKSMTASLQVPHVTIGEQADMTGLKALYKSLRENPPKSAAEEGLEPVKVTITPFIIKALSLALEKVPIMNSKFNGDSYLLYKNHNISVAINSKYGLVVPNIKNVNKLTVRQIQRELNRLQESANSRKLGMADIRGGTCSLSNLGPIGGTYVMPRLFDGQATIVAMGRPLDKAVPEDFRLELRSFCNLAVTSDHRHLDGATIATFAVHLRLLLQDTEELRKHF